jgi:isobutyryl-CoA dehydrogenase
MQPVCRPQPNNKVRSLFNRDASSCILTALAQCPGDDYVLNGTKAFISGAGDTDVYLVMCRTGVAGPKGISCVVVPKDSGGLSFGKNEDKLGWNCQPTRMVHFDQCRVPIANRLGAEGDGFRMAMQALNGGRINIASTSLGAAQHAIEVTLDHVRERRQFGSTLASFQNTQFRLAECAADLLSARLLVRAAADTLDRASQPTNDQIGYADPVAMAAVAKMIGTERCYAVIDQCLQLFGGYGYLKDYPLQQLLRDTRVNRILEGTNEVMRLLVARHLLAV